MFTLTLFCICFHLLSLTIAQDDPIREVEQGSVRGFSYRFQEDRFIGIDKYLDIFYGIPFAEPPIGDLRWQLPVPKAKWDGILNATARSAACYQENPATLYLRKSEDCLYLNVYAPHPKPSDAAVMVFFHGGGFSFGSAMQYEYDGAPLTAVGDVIYVAVNYRLNVFGYMSTGDEAASGNYGMFDQVESLKWVQRNIDAFGGDPNRVTIFGESAGAASSSFHLLSKGSHSLFNQVILESGASPCDWAFTEIERAQQQALVIAQECGCDTSNTMAMVECLRTKNMRDVFDASVVAGLFGGATVDGVFLEDLPINILERGDFKNVNIMLGTNQDEGAIYALAVYPNYILADDPPHMNKSDFEREVPRFLSEDNPVFLDAMYQEYTPWDEADQAGADYLRSFIDIQTDPTFACPTDIVARAHAEAGDNVYMYQMTRDPSASLLSIGPLGPGWTGAAHSEELQFVFGSPFMETNLHGKMNDNDTALTVEFMKYWTNFAKTGDPNDASDVLASWPLFTVPDLEYLMLDLKSTVGRALKSKPCAFWNDYMVKLRSFAGDLAEVERQWRYEFYDWTNHHMPEWKKEFDDYKEATGQCDKDGGCK